MKRNPLLILGVVILFGAFDILKTFFFTVIVFIIGMAVIILFGAYDAYKYSTSKTYRLQHG